MEKSAFYGILAGYKVLEAALIGFSLFGVK